MLANFEKCDISEIEPADQDPFLRSAISKDECIVFILNPVVKSLFGSDLSTKRQHSIFLPEFSEDV